MIVTFTQDAPEGTRFSADLALRVAESFSVPGHPDLPCSLVGHEVRDEGRSVRVRLEILDHAILDAASGIGMPGGPTADAS